MIIYLISIKGVKKKRNAFIVAWAQFIDVNIKWLIKGVLLKRGFRCGKALNRGSVQEHSTISNEKHSTKKYFTGPKFLVE